LPEGIYIVPEVTTGVVFGSWNPADRTSRYDCYSGGTSATTVLDYPEIAPVSESSGDDWIVYQFSPDGRLDLVDCPDCPGTGLVPVNNQIILAPGVLDESGIVEFNNSEDIAGMVVRRNGTSIVVQDPADFF